MLVQNKRVYWDNTIHSKDSNKRASVKFAYEGNAARCVFPICIQFSGLINLKMTDEDFLIFEVNDLNNNGNIDICNRKLGYSCFQKYHILY